MSAPSSGPSLPSGAPSEATDSQPVPKTLDTFDSKYANRVMLILMGIVMVVLYIEGMLVPSLPTIESDFSIDPAQASLIVSTYAISGVALSPVVGKLGDIYGKRKLLMATMLCYAAAVSVTGFSPNFTFMIVARTVQGIGLTILPLGMSLVREEFPRELVPRAQGLLSAMFGIGFAISLPLGSYVSQTYGWRWTYHSAIPVVVLLAALVVFVLKESAYRRPNVRVDYLGAVLFGGALAGVVTALSEGETWGWSSPLTIGFAVVGALLFVPFALYEVWWKNQGREPIVDAKLLQERNVLVTNIVLTIVGLGMYLALFSLIYQFEFGPASGGYNSGFNFFNLNSYSILDAGLEIIPLALSMTLIAVLASVLVSRTGVKPLALGGAVLTAIGFYLLSTARSLDQALLCEVVTGAGIALLNASIINLLVLTVDPKDMGQATAMNNVFRNVGSSLGAPIAGSLLSTYVVTAYYSYHGVSLPVSVPALAGFQYAFLIAAAITVVGGLAILFGEEVLGARRHAKFAHHPQMKNPFARHRPGRAQGPEPSSPPGSPPTPS